MYEKTFAELFCEKRKLRPEDYVEGVFRETLYPHARLLGPLLKMLWPRYFSADIEFVQCVGMLRRYREFFNETEEYAHHPENRGFWRTTINLRVSSRRMRRLVRATLHGDASQEEDGEEHSAVPFSAEQVKPEAKASTPSKFLG